MTKYGSMRLGGIFVLLSVLFLGGCATQQPLPVYQISLDNQLILAKLAPAVRYRTTSIDAPLEAIAKVRFYSPDAPRGGYSAFCEAGLKEELISAQHYASDSEKSIEVTVVKLKFQDNVAELAARFVVRHKEVIVYSKVLSVTSTWELSSLAPIAVLEAIPQYGAIFQKLQRKLFEDAAFVKLK